MRDSLSVMAGPALGRLGHIKYRADLNQTLHTRYSWVNSREEPVTIALGILTHDAVVIAADSQITSADYLKYGQNKISTVRQSSPEGQLAAMAVTGSGNAAYLRHLKKDFSDVLDYNKKAPTTERMLNRVRKRLKEFHEEHVLPISDPRPDVWLLIGYRDRNKMGLWSSEYGVVSETTNYAAVGIGETYAKLLMERLYPAMWPPSLRMATLLAAYVAYQTCEHVPGVGKKIDIVQVDTNRVSHVRREVTKVLSECFEDLAQLEATMLRLVFDDNPRSASEKLLQVMAIRERVEAILPNKPDDILD
jgi:20S proteasome alpha/beta subunit